MVGMSGSMGERFLPVTAMGINRLALIKGRAVEMLAKANVT